MSRASSHPVSPQTSNPFHTKNDAQMTPVGDLMTRPAITVSEELSVEWLAGMFLEQRISGAPVVNAEGQLVGVVSMNDLVREHYFRGDTGEVDGPVRLTSDPGVSYSPGNGFHLKDGNVPMVREVMSPKAISVTEMTTVAQAARLMAKNHIHRLPVVNEAGVVVGLLSSTDVLGWLAG